MTVSKGVRLYNEPEPLDRREVVANGAWWSTSFLSAECDADQGLFNRIHTQEHCMSLLFASFLLPLRVLIWINSLAAYP